MTTRFYALLAQVAAPAGGANPAPAGNEPLSGFGKLFEGPYFLMMLIMAMLYFMVLRPQKKDQSKRATMLAGLKKNDTVLTTAGIFGKVVQANDGSEDITIRVDENANTRIRILRSSVVQVITGDNPRSESSTST